MALPHANMSLVSGGVVYPDSDGKPMADNTKQFNWIVRLKENLDGVLPDFVAGDLFWYPVEGDPGTRVAPDVLVAFGRPKGDRSSYRQWEEGGVPPQVVFEIWSPNNTFPELVRKKEFYERFGVEEFYVLDPDRHTLSVWQRAGGALEGVAVERDHTSSLLGIRFEVRDDGVEVFHRDGRRFPTWGEVQAAADLARGEADLARGEADLARSEADRARSEADRARKRSEALAEALRAAGIDPDSLTRR